jgi:hypothetical protein
MTNAQIRHLRALISAGLLDFGCQKTLGNEEVFGNELGFLSATPTRPRMDVFGDGGTAGWLNIRRVQSIASCSIALCIKSNEGSRG